MKHVKLDVQAAEVLSIDKIEVFQVDLPLKEIKYMWSGGRQVTSLDCTIVRVHAGDFSGLGEVTPLGPTYLPSSNATGVREAIKSHIGPAILGMNPINIGQVYAKMDEAIKGEYSAKSAIDMACWDLFGKFSKQPLWRLLGGKFGDSIILYRAISSGTPDEMLQSVKSHYDHGYRRFQLKSGGGGSDMIKNDIRSIRTIAEFLKSTGEPTMLTADSNCGWLPSEARRICNAVADIDVFIEQPCSTLEECLMVRTGTSLPMILDELIVDVTTLIRAHRENMCDAINLKISKVGGISKARIIRDVAVSIGFPMVIEDQWGGDIIQAAIASLAHSTPEKFRLASTDFSSYVSISTAKGAPVRINGTMKASDEPGLGVELITENVGNPLFVVSQ